MPAGVNLTEYISAWTRTVRKHAIRYAQAEHFGAEERKKMNKLNIAIADDNERMLDLLGNIIHQDKELELVGQAENGKDVYEIIKTKEPDVVLLDIFMPKMDGLTVM